MINFLDQLCNIDHTWTKNLNESCHQLCRKFHTFIQLLIQKISWSSRLIKKVDQKNCQCDRGLRVPYYLVYWCLSNTSVSRIEAPVDDVYRGYYNKSLIRFRRVLIRQIRFRLKNLKKLLPSSRILPSYCFSEEIFFPKPWLKQILGRPY